MSASRMSGWTLSAIIALSAVCPLSGSYVQSDALPSRYDPHDGDIQTQATPPTR